MARMNTDAKYMPLYAKREIFCKGTAILCNAQYQFFGIFSRSTKEINHVCTHFKKKCNSDSC